MKYTDLENAMSRHFHLVQQSEVKQGKYCGKMEFSLWAAPAFRLSKDGMSGQMSCDTFTYRFYRENDKNFCRVVMKRAEALFADFQGKAVMTDLEWYTIQEMDPWEYGDNETPFASSCTYPAIPAPHVSAADDVLAIRNLQNMFFEHRLLETGEMFTNNAVIDLGNLTRGEVGGRSAIEECFARVLESEKDNHHCYRNVTISSSPVIEVLGDHAQGLFTTIVFGIEADDEDRTKWKLRRHFAALSCSYEKQDGAWKISEMKETLLADIPTMRYHNDRRYDRGGQSEEPWSLDQEMPVRVHAEGMDGGAAAADASADLMEVENVINGWAYGCRRGELPAFVEDRYKNPENDNYMWIHSTPTTKEILDLDGIRAKCNDLTSHYCDRYFTFHAPTTPCLQMSADGLTINGTWYDCGTTNLQGMAESDEKIPYMVFVNKYHHTFRKMNGKWYITAFRNEPIIALPDWSFDMVHSLGYISDPENKVYPHVFELRMN